jgi:hypothetical protein
MADEVAKFSIKVDADASPAKEAAAELEKFRSTISKAQGNLESYRKSQSLLRGSSDEVKQAKSKLAAAIDLEKGKVSQANLGILKLGGSYDKLQKAAKKNRVETDAAKKTITAVGGPVKGLFERFEGLKNLMPALASGWGLLAAGVAVGVSALALAGATVAELTIKFSEWLLVTADANRNLELQREAFAGSAKEGTAWGHILDWASEKTALTTAQLQALVIETNKTYRGFRISGQGMVDAFKASAAAAGAGRPDVAAFFNEIISRGKLTGRSFISAPDIAGFRNAGIKVEDLYKALGISAAQAQRGVSVSTDKMAEALRKLSENRFADLNKKKLLSLGAQWDHFKDNLMRLTNDLIGEGGALEPLLKAIGEVLAMFDLTTESGQELKKSVTEYGMAIATWIVGHKEDIKQFALNVIKITEAFIDGVAAVVRWSQSAEGLFIIKSVLIGIAVAAGVVFIAFLPLIVVVLAIVAVFVLIGLAIYGIYKAVQYIKGLDWGSIGKSIVDGIKNGLEAAWEGLKKSITTLADGIKSIFKKALLIGSPSVVFQGYGVNTGEGYQRGLDASQPGVKASAKDMAQSASEGANSVAVTSPEPKSALGGGGGGTDQSRTLTVGSINNVFHVSGKNAEEIKEKLSSKSFLDGLESSIRTLLQTQGIPTGAPSTSGGP